MSLNKPSLIKRFIGVAGNIITHKLLVKAEIEEELRGYYSKEIKRDIGIAARYRSKINPSSMLLPEKDSTEIREKILIKVKAELRKRFEKGYMIDLTNAEEEIDTFLKEQKVN